jgi:DNA-binding NarL/FixJ family response regulator
MDDLRVVIMAHDPLARAGLAALLSNQAGCHVVGQIAPDGDWLPELDLYRPDVIVWDLGWESGPPPEALADLSEDGPPVIALVADEESALEVWTAGARGMLFRHTPTETLLAAIHAVAHGLAALDPALARALPLARSVPPGDDLTPRELEVLRLVAEGLANRAIALRLDISEHTVKFHLNAILGKLGAQSRTEAVVQAARRGLIAL